MVPAISRNFAFQTWKTINFFIVSVGSLGERSHRAASSVVIRTRLKSINQRFTVVIDGTDVK